MCEVMVSTEYFSGRSANVEQWATKLSDWLTGSPRACGRLPKCLNESLLWPKRGYGPWTNGPN